MAPRKMNKKKKLVDGQRKAAKNVPKPGGRRLSSRHRVQTVLHQVPVPAIRKRNTHPGGGTPKTKKGGKGVKVAKVGKGVKKVAAKKTPKQPKVSKKGNDRLVARDGVKELKEDPFFSSPQVPEYVSSHVYFRWLMRAVRKGDLKEIQNIFKSKKIPYYSEQPFYSYGCSNTACYEVLKKKDVKFATEFFKLNHKLNSTTGYSPISEPNLLEYRSSGRGSRFMIGRHTRQVEMSRGGKEGNNALLKYESRTDAYAPLEKAIQDNTPYTTLYQMSKIPNGPFQEHEFEMHLVTAARMGHRELASALAQGPAKNHMNELHRHTLKGDKLPEKILPVSVIKKGFMNKNITPIHTAAITNNSSMLETIRSVYPTINIPDQDNWYTIHYAAVCDGSEPLKFLLKNGGTVTQLNKRMETPLHVAARAGRAANIKILLKEMLDLEKGEDGNAMTRPDRSLINARNRTGITPLQLAVVWNRSDAVDELLSEPTIVVDQPTSTTTNKLTALMLAAGWGHLEMAKKLVAHGALVEAKDKKKRTPLIHAMLSGQTHVASYLLKLGANIHAADSSGNTAAHYAAAYGFLESLKLLASVDDDILGVANDWQMYPTSVAYLKGHYGIVTWLLDGPHKDKANINAKDNQGATLLACLMANEDDAYQNQLDQQMEYLISRGAVSNIENINGDTPLHHFARMRVIFKGSGEAPEVDATRMTMDQYLKCFQMLLDSGANVEAMNHQQNTPLHLAIENGNLYLFSKMLDKVQNKKELFDKWSMNQNFLHEILALPMNVYQDPILWKGETLKKSAYDILPTLVDLHKDMGSLFEKWVNEPNKEGFSPIVAAVKLYAKLASNKNVQGAESQARPKANRFNPYQHRQVNPSQLPHVDSIELRDFISTVNDLFEWVIRLDPGQLLQEYVPSVDQPTKFYLAGLAMNIQLEDGKHEQNHLAFFKILLKLAKEFNVLEKFFNIKNELDNTMIITAIMMDNPKVVELILDTSSEKQIIAGVHNAILKYQAAEKLINKTVLMCLVEMRMWDLLEKVNAPSSFWSLLDENGDNLWHYAARVNSHKTVSLFKLLEFKNVDLKLKNKHGRSVLHIATLACDGSANAVLEPITWLSTRCSFDIDLFGRTPLHYAFGSEADFNQNALSTSEMDPIAVVSLLSSMMKPEELNQQDIDKNTALHLAAIRNSTICIMTLLRKKCEVDLLNKDDNTPLGLAVLNSRQSSALTLIQGNAQIDKLVHIIPPKKIDDFKKTKWVWKGMEKEEVGEVSSIPAQVVAKGGSWEAMVYVLIDVLGANVQSITQLTDAAIKRGQYNLANQLLKTIGALLDQNVIKDAGLFDTMARYCNRSMNEDTIEKTVADRIIEVQGLTNPIKQEKRERFENLNNAVRIAMENGNWEFVKYVKKLMGNEWALEDFGPDANPFRSIAISLVNKGVTLDALAFLRELTAMKKLKKTVLCTFDIPERFKIANIEKCTPLGWAVLKGKANVVKILRQSGFLLDDCDEEKRSPLMYALMVNDQDVVEAVVGDGKDVVVIPKKVVKKAQKGVRTVFRAMVTKTNGLRVAARSVPAGGGSDDEEEEEEEEEEDNEEESSSEEGSGDEEEEEAPPAKKARYEAAKPKLLTIHDPSLFRRTDSSNRNALHYFVEPLAWENAELLRSFAESNKKLIVEMLIAKNQPAPNPVELAAELKHRKILAEMLKIIKGEKLARPIKEIESAIEPVDVPALSNVDEDCKKFLEKWALEHDKKQKATVPKPHANSTYSTSGELVYDDETEQYFDVLLNKTDMNYGRYGFYNFYRMQIIKRRDAQLWILYTNWGRIGQGSGERQTTPFNTLELVKKEFKSVWKSKTGNEWDKLENFEEQPKKYRLVESDSTPSSLSGVELSWEKNEEKDVIRRMIADVSDSKKLKEYAGQVLMHNSGISHPFGRFTKESIEKAKKVLDECEKNSEKLQRMCNGTTTIVESELLRLHQITNDLSGQYYSLIPTGDFEFSSLTRLDNPGDITRHREKLNRYAEIETATRFLCGAEERKDLDRVEYLKSAMQCEFREEDPESDISQKLLEWIHNSSEDKMKVQSIVEIRPKKATEKFEKFVNDSNQKFLFHGTKATNLMSIISNGFLVDPPTATRNGNLFGSGVYLADSFEKSTHYCSPSADGVQYMLVCQVALGQEKKMTKLPYHYGALEEGANKGDTCHYYGSKIPSGSLTTDGVAIPLLPIKQREEDPNESCSYAFRTLDWSEYIVRNPERVLPRYIVSFK